MFNVQFHPICTWNFPQFPQPGAFFSRSWHSALYNMPMPSTHGTVNGLDLIQFCACQTHRASRLLALRVALVLGRPEFILLMAGRMVMVVIIAIIICSSIGIMYIYISRALQVCDSSNVCLLHFSVNVGVSTATIPILWSCFSKPLHKQSAAPGCCSLQCSQPQASKSPEYAATCWNMCHGRGRRRPRDVMTIPRL